MTTKSPNKVRKRSENFEFNEEQKLLQLIEKYKNIIENKKSDRETNDMKTQIWDKLTDEFNTSRVGRYHRAVHVLKRKYENIKKLMKKGKMIRVIDSHEENNGDTLYDYIHVNAIQLENTSDLNEDSDLVLNKTDKCISDSDEEGIVQEQTHDESYNVARRKKVKSSFLDSVPVRSSQKDDCDLYADLLAFKLKKMDERTRDIVMNKIDNLIFETKLNAIQSS